MRYRLLSLVISIIFYIFQRCYLVRFSLFKNAFPGSLVVLTYHSIIPEQILKFKTQMEYVLKVGKPVIPCITDALNIRQRCIAITFDDGFESVLKYALPVLKEKKIPATIFVPTGYLGKKPGWTKNLNDNPQNEVVLSKEQLNQLPKDLIVIGSHCVTHPNLANIDEDKVIMSELVNSKMTLEEVLGSSVTLLSFPFGGYNKKVIELSRKANYKRVFENNPRFSFSKTNKFLHGRINIRPDEWKIEFRLKCSNSYQWLPIAYFAKRQVINIFRKILGWNKSG